MKTKNETDEQIAIVATKSKADQMKDYLEAQPKVSTRIPLEKGEKPGTMQPFTINGYTVNYPKGVRIQVPEQIDDMISVRFGLNTLEAKALGNKNQATKDALN